MSVFQYLVNKSCWLELYPLRDYEPGLNLIPSYWLSKSLTNQPFLDNAWSSSSKQLPQFFDFMKRATDEIFIATTNDRTEIIYYLQYESELDSQSQDSFIIAGLPIDSAQIDEFEKNHGRIPESLLSLWKTHNFLLLGDGSKLSTLSKLAQVEFGSPKVLNRKVLKSNSSDEFECLSIIDSDQETSWCLTKKTGASTWKDEIRLVGNGNEFLSYGSYSLDSLLLMNSNK